MGGVAWSKGVPGPVGVPYPCIFGGGWSGGCLVMGEGSGLGGGVGFPGPHPKGKFREIWSRPTPKREVEGDLVQVSPHTLPPDGYCCGLYASYWNA